MEKSESRVAHDALLLLHRYGQSLWWNGLTRNMIISGQLKQLVEKEGLTGVTTNFSVLAESVASKNDYDYELSVLKRASKKTNEVREALLVEDVRMAADIMRTVYEQTSGADGYVAFDLSPYAMESADEIIAEASRVFSAVGRKNAMAKVPATSAGIVAFEHLIARGVNVAVFGVMTPEGYRQVAMAYLSGLEKFVRRGGDPISIAAIAELPIAEIDKLSDEFMQAQLEPKSDQARRQAVEECLGQAAFATARGAYAVYKQLFGGKRNQEWKLLAAKGARPQRLMFSYTSAISPKSDEQSYIQSLVGTDTVVALNQTDIDAFSEQFAVHPALEGKAGHLMNMREKLEKQGITLGEQLAAHQEGQVDLSIVALDTVLAAIEKRLAL